VGAGFPKLAGQYRDYLYIALKSYKTEGNPSVGRGNAVMGGVAGLAAGYALSKAMEGGANHSNSAASNNAANPANDSAGYVPFDNPSRPDMGAFDAGSGGDSWDVGQAPMDDDEW